jgi:hypothetical protein
LSITSRYGDEVRLERKVASGVTGVLDPLQIGTKE